MSEIQAVIIANPKPFRLILRDERDIWECSTEQVNRSTYNYVKLHRATRFIDVNLKRPFTLGLGYDGSLILPLIEDYANPNKALDEFNRVIAACFIGGLYIEAVSPSDLSFGHIANCGYYRHEHPLGITPNFTVLSVSRALEASSPLSFIVRLKYWRMILNLPTR